MATASEVSLDVDIHNLLMDLLREPVRPVAVKGLTLPEPVFPQYPEKLLDPGSEIAVKNGAEVCLASIGHARMAVPILTFRELEFHPITAYLFVECKCNLDCWRCWASTTR